MLQCYLACHKRCLETLAIQCGHKKLQGRLQLFGQEFSQVSSSSSDGIPFLIKKCTCEIERRALRMKVRIKASDGAFVIVYIRSTEIQVLC